MVIKQLVIALIISQEIAKIFVITVIIIIISLFIKLLVKVPNPNQIQHPIISIDFIILTITIIIMAFKLVIELKNHQTNQ